MVLDTFLAAVLLFFTGELAMLKCSVTVNGQNASAMNDPVARFLSTLSAQTALQPGREQLTNEKPSTNCAIQSGTCRYLLSLVFI